MEHAGRMASDDGGASTTTQGCGRHNNTYSCARCGYASYHFGNYKRHISNKRMCAPRVSTTIPTVSNVQVRKLSEEPDAVQGRAPPGVESHANNRIHNSPGSSISTTHNTYITNKDDHHTTHNHITHNHIYAFGKEDMSHVTPQLLDNLVRWGAQDGNEAVTFLVAHVHFNPAKPENMNVYMPPPVVTSDGKQTISRAYVYDGHRWREEPSHDHTVLSMIRDRAWDLMDHVENKPDGLSASISERFERFYDTDFMNDAKLREGVRDVAIRRAKIVKIAAKNARHPVPACTLDVGGPRSSDT